MSGDFGSALSGVGSGISNAFGSIGSGLGNMFGGGGGGGAPAGDSSGGIGSDFVAGLSNDIFNTTDPSGSAAATASITPPAQAAQAAATGTDPSGNVGGTQTGQQTASTGPSGNPNQANQNDAEQDQRSRAIDELRREIKRRQQHLQSPWTVGQAQAGTGVGRGPAGVASGLYSPNISPDAAVKAGLLDPSMIDPATGTIRRDQPPAAEDPTGSSVEPTPPERVPTQLFTPGSVPRGTGGGGHPDFVPADELYPLQGGQTGGGTVGDMQPDPTAKGLGGGGPSLSGAISGLGSVTLPEIIMRALGPAGVYFGSTTPAETGELPEQYWPKAAAPDDTGPPPEPGYPPITTTEGRPDIHRPEDPAKPKAKPKGTAKDPAAKPRQVWVPETPGHYVPTTDNVRGPATWVRGTPGHYETVQPAAGGQKGPSGPPGGPQAALKPDTSVPTRKEPEAAPGPSMAQGSDLQGKPPEGAPPAEAPPMAYRGPMEGTQGMPPMLRDILSIAMPALLGALAGDAGGNLPSMFAGNMGMFGRGRHGGFRFPGMWRGGPLRAGYYPHIGAPGMHFHPGGYHPGWGHQDGRAPGGNWARAAQGGNYRPTGNRFMDSLVGIESNGRGDAWGDRGRGNARGFTQIQDATWHDFARRAGVDLNQFPTADRADQATQLRVASTIPFYRFGDRTRRLLHQQFGNFDERLTVGQLMQQFGGAMNVAGGGEQPGQAPAPALAGDLQGKPNEGGAPPTQYTGPDQPDINANAG